MKRLVKNVKDALQTTGAKYKIDVQWTRLFLRTAAAPEDLEFLSRIPGISSYSSVVARSSADLDEVIRTGVEHFGEAVRGRSFAVRPRRSGRHSYSSGDIGRKLGSALNIESRVDLTNPEVEVEVEVRDEDAYFYSGKSQGLGGLPLAVEGRAVCLISGGFDSAVASWMMLKRGVRQDYLFCNLAGEAYEKSVAQVSKILADNWSYGTQPNLHVVDFSSVLDELRARTEPKFWQLVLKRLMYRTGDMLAEILKAQALITGEAIGQVSSQTLANLAAIDRASRVPVFRPLIGFDKLDIVEISRRIRTYPISSQVKEYCAIAPGNPATNATTRETEREEAKLDPDILMAPFEKRRILDLRAIDDIDLAAGYLFTEDVPSNAIVIDIRSEEEWDAWHYPDSVNHPAWQLTTNPRSLGRDRTYVLYCDRGTQAAQVAEAMQRAGVEAYAFRGGTEAIRRRSRG